MRELVADLKRDEGLRLKPYRCTAGKLTIGYGRNIEDNGITEAEAQFLLIEDARRSADELEKALPWLGSAPTTVKRGLTNMAFNLGWPRLSAFKQMLGALESGDYAKAADEALNSNWAKQVGDRAKRVAALFRESAKPTAA